MLGRQKCSPPYDAGHGGCMSAINDALSKLCVTLGFETPMSISILVEDPGAANFAAGMLGALKEHGAVTVHARGAGASQLGSLGVCFQSLGDPFDARCFLESAKPSLVVLGTSEDTDAAAHMLVVACREAGIATIGIIDGPANTASRFRGDGPDALEYAPDRIFAPSVTVRDTLVDLGYSEDRINVVPHPHFVAVAEQREILSRDGKEVLRRRLFPEAGDRPVLVFLAERSGGLDPDQFCRTHDYTLVGRGGEQRRTHIVLEEVLDSVGRADIVPYIVLRLHPKNDADEFASYQTEFDMVSREENALEVCFGADIVVGLTTILLVEAAVLGTQVLSVVPREVERHWLLDAPTGPISCFWKRDELAGALEEALRSHVKQALPK